MKALKHCRPETVNEILRYIINNGGPDFDRKANPGIKSVKYEYLSEVLSILNRKKKYSQLRPYHFTLVHQMWNYDGVSNKELAYDLIDELITHLIKKRGSLCKAIELFSINDFKKERLTYKTNWGRIIYTAENMIQKVRFDGKTYNSPYLALKYWIDNNKNIKIRKEFKDLKPYHINKSSQAFWKKADSKAEARKLVDIVMKQLIKQHKSIAGALKHIDSIDFNCETLIFKNSFGTIKFNISGMFNSVQFFEGMVGSHFNAIKYWGITHENNEIRTAFNNFRPYYMPHGVVNMWKGKQGLHYGMELMDIFVKRMASPERYGSIENAIMRVKADDFRKEIFEFDTGDGILDYSIKQMFQRVKFDDIHKNSPYAAIKYWILNNKDANIRKKYLSLKPENRYYGKYYDKRHVL